VEEKDKKIEELVLKIESQGEINQSLISEIARLKDELNEERCSIKETLAIRDSELVSIKKLLDDQTKTLLEELDKTAKLTSELSALKATAWTEKLVWKFSRYVWTCLSNGVAPDEPSAWLASRKAEKGRA
jgi:predicted RNase H-like nuclease (RuvC/YqgF family)